MAEGDADLQPETPAVSSGWEEASVIEGKVTLTAADFTNTVANLPRTKGPWWLLPGVGFAALVVWNLLESVPLMTNLAMTSVFALFVYVQMRKRRAWDTQLSRLFRGVTTFRFDEQGVSMQAGSLPEHRMTWGSLVGHGETPESFFVYMASRALVVVPKRAFAAGELVVIREWLRSRVVSKPAATAAGAGRGKLLAWVVLFVALLSIWHFLSVDKAPRHGAHKARSVRAE